MYNRDQQYGQQQAPYGGYGQQSQPNYGQPPQYGQPQLPMPVDQLVTNVWFNNPFQERLPIPQVRLAHQGMQATLPTLMAVFVDDLQKNSRSGPLSTFAYNLFSRNWYGNPEFATVFQDLVDHAFHAIAKLNPPQQQVMQLVTDVALRHAGIAIAQCVNLFPALQASIPQDRFHQVMQQLNQDLQFWNQLRQEMDRAAPMAQGYGQQPHQPQYGRRQEDMSHLVVNTSGYQSQQRPAPQQPQQDARPMSDSLLKRRGGASQPVTNDLRNLGVTEVMGTVNNQPVQETAPTLPRYQAQQDTRPRPDSYAQQPAQPAPATVDVDDEFDIENIVYANEKPVSEPDQSQFPDKSVERHILPVPPVGLSDNELLQWNSQPGAKIVRFFGTPERPWDKVELEGGILLVPALLSSYTVGRTPERPLTNYGYNPLTTVKFHLIDADGEATECLLAREFSMDYLHHELDLQLRAEEQRRLGKAANVMPDWTMVRRITPRPAKPIVLEQKAMVEADQIYQSERGFGSDSLDEALRSQPIIVEQTTLANTIADVLGNVVDSYRDLLRSEESAIPFVIAPAEAKLAFSVEFDEETHDALCEARHSKNPALALLRVLTDYDESKRDRLYNRLVDLLTERFNFFIKHSLGVDDLTITNIVDDYEEALDLISDDYDQQHATQLRRLMNEFVTQWQFSRREKDKFNFIEQRHGYVVVYLDHSLVGLGVPMDGTATLTASGQPELFAIYDHARKVGDTLNDHSGAPVYLADRAGRVAQLLPSAWDSNFAVIDVVGLHGYSVL